MAEQVNVAYVFPGQGAQWVGMGRDLYNNLDSAKAVFKQADEALGLLSTLPISCGLRIIRLMLIVYVKWTMLRSHNPFA